MTNPLLSRKFLLAVFALASVTLLTLLDKVHEGVYSTVVIATVGAYLTANVTQKKVTVQ